MAGATPAGRGRPSCSRGLRPATEAGDGLLELYEGVARHALTGPSLRVGQLRFHQSIAATVAEIDLATSGTDKKTTAHNTELRHCNPIVVRAALTGDSRESRAALGQRGSL